jgi:hypothetical protein
MPCESCAFRIPDSDFSTYRSRCLFSTNLAERIRVFGVDVVVFFQRKGVIIHITLGEADTVRGFTTGDDNFLDAQLACWQNPVRYAI